MSIAPERLQAWERFAPLTGVVAVVFVCVGFIVFESADRPGEGASPNAHLAYFDREGGPILGGTYLVALGLLFFVWFLASLRSRLVAAEGGVGRLSTLAFAGGVVMTVLFFAGLAPSVSGVFALEGDGRLSPEAADALENAGDGFFFLSWWGAVLLLLATALVILRTRAFPFWLAVVTLVIAVALIVPWIGWIAFLFALPLWILVVSVWMFVRPVGRPVEAAPPRAAE